MPAYLKRTRVRCGRQLTTFFDDVMVMVDDPAVRANRLALLHSLRSLF